MLGNLPIWQLVLLLAVSVGIFVFLALLVLPGKEEKKDKKLKPVIPTGKNLRVLPGIDEVEAGVLLAMVAEKIDQLNVKLEGYLEIIKKIETENLERIKKQESNLIRLSQMVERIEPFLSQLKIGATSGADEEALSKLTEKITLLEEKIDRPVAERTEIDEVKNRLNEVVTILKTLGS